MKPLYKFLIAAAVALSTATLLMTWRSFPPRLGWLSGIAVGALAFHALGIATRLKHIHHRPKTGSITDDEPESGG